MRTLLCLLLILGVGSMGVRAADGDVALPKLPAAYKDYTIDPNSVSPDQQYGVMYLSAPPDDEKTVVKNFVVALKPFRVVVELCKGDAAYFADRSNSEIVVNWAKDSSVAVVMLGIKWGPGLAYVVPIQKGQPGKIVELTAEVTKFVQPDLKKVKYEPYNDTYDFVFVGDNDWKINDKGQVVIAVDCSTNPKGDSGIKSWDGSFTGLWDIAQGKFVEHTFKRTFAGVHPEQ